MAWRDSSTVQSIKQEDHRMSGWWRTYSLTPKNWSNESARVGERECIYQGARETGRPQDNYERGMDGRRVDSISLTDLGA